MNISDVLSQCEDFVRTGQIDRARALLREINSAKIVDAWRFPLANMCRRTGLDSLGIKFLTPPRMDDREKWIQNSTPQEVAEYAVLIQRIGSVNLALKVLNRLDPAVFPDALLYRAFCHFNRWEYAEAVPELER